VNHPAVKLLATDPGDPSSADHIQDSAELASEGIANLTELAQHGNFHAQHAPGAASHGAAGSQLRRSDAAPGVAVATGGWRDSRGASSLGLLRLRRPDAANSREIAVQQKQSAAAAVKVCRQRLIAHGALEDSSHGGADAPELSSASSSSSSSSLSSSHPFLYRLHRFLPPRFMARRWADDEVLPLTPPLDVHRIEVRTAAHLRSVCESIRLSMGLGPGLSHATPSPAGTGSDMGRSDRSRISDRGATCPRILAVDVEAHSQESFQGLTCLLQLSTSLVDVLVDTLRLGPTDCGPL